MAKSKTHIVEEKPLDQRKLTNIQAERLASLASVKDTKLEGLTIAKASELLKWKIDPDLFLFREICGKVVKPDPVTGIDYPVPYATVYVEDVICNLFGYFPDGWPWGWFFPFLCRYEVIATTTTDACGNFCVLVPRFDIEWILRWREERVCFPIIFQRPTVGSLLPDKPLPGTGAGSVTGADPVDGLLSLPTRTIGAMGGSTAVKLARQVARLKSSQTFGGQNQAAKALLNTRLFDTELPPPLPVEFQRALAGKENVVAAKGASPLEGIRSALALKLGLNPAAKEIAGFDPRRYIGPFFRCYDVFIPEWTPIFNVPDIAFRVTQDVNGDGTQEMIYPEGSFDVNINSGALSDVTLVASQNAIASSINICQVPDVAPCNNVPEIQLAGVMPLTDASIFNATTGYALGPNRPSTCPTLPVVPPDPPCTNPPCPASPNPPRPESQAPFCETVPLFGCVDVLNAQYYCIQLSTDGGATFLPVTLSFWNGLVHIVPVNGYWYAVNPGVPRNQLDIPTLILVWPTPPLNECVLYIQIADGNYNVIQSSQKVTIQTDNTAPNVVYQELSWKFASASDNTLQSLLGIPCPMIKRGSTPQDIEVVFQVIVSANHLRDACIYASGCGGGSFGTVADPLNEQGHWHENVNDNTVTLYQRYSLAATAQAGCYSFGSQANSRAMNPDGQDSGDSLGWIYDPIYIYNLGSISVAIVDED
jgi:hypothetical protein